MPALGVAMQKSLLDWMLGGAVPAAPAGRFMGLATGSPTSVASSEIATGSGYSRGSASFGAAATPAGSGTASNVAAVTFGPFSSAQSISGVFVADNVASGSGTLLVQGLLTTARTVASGDSLVVGPGALIVTIA